MISAYLLAHPLVKTALMAGLSGGWGAIVVDLRIFAAWTPIAGEAKKYNYAVALIRIAQAAVAGFVGALSVGAVL
jgi:hypothetical protein